MQAKEGGAEEPHLYHRRPPIEASHDESERYIHQVPFTYNTEKTAELRVLLTHDDKGFKLRV